MTHHCWAIGDNGKAHLWKHDEQIGIEEMTRVCDGKVATQLDVWARDKDSDREVCGACEEGRRWEK